MVAVVYGVDIDDNISATHQTHLRVHFSMLALANVCKHIHVPKTHTHTHTLRTIGLCTIE